MKRAETIPSTAPSTGPSTGHAAPVNEPQRAYWNGARWTASGHYESWFARANHPTRPLGFWIRYTIFSPAGQPTAAEGELWAVMFDGETGTITAARQAWPVLSCTFNKTNLDVQMPGAAMSPDSLHGSAESGGHRLSWDLRYSAPASPLLLLDSSLYRSSFPKAKAVVPTPLSSFAGAVVVDGKSWPVDGWVGSQCHNWGQRHTDRYAWGQVMGFDDAPNACLEVATAQVRVGPWMTPPLTVLALRLDDEEYALNTLFRATRSRGTYDYRRFQFRAQDRRIRIVGVIEARAADFVGLSYRNPPGGVKTCLNTKIARCELTVERAGREACSLHSRSRAAFEILTDATDHGIALRC